MNGPEPDPDPDAEETATVRRLDDRTIDRIAAGEVITRPARVVAELVDNALDAGTDRIEVHVVGDGTDEIRVVDDGRGMSRADARRAVRRHTTSKLRDGEDPVGVASLGFRGEALAAIAEAGRLELRTNDGGPAGTRIRVTGTPPLTDEDVRVDDVGRARGTTVVVRDLFGDRPARREALAGERTEFSRISDLIADYALARPDVAFSLTHDDATSATLSTPGRGRTDAFMGVYDRETASRSTELDASVTTDAGDTGKIEMTGTLAYPSATRASRDHVRIAVNGRPVENPALSRAVRAGYGRLVPDGREPVAAIDVSVPPELVDPNVHPAKREVGIADADAVAMAVEQAVGDALTGADLRRRAEVATDLETALEPVDGDRFADVEPIGQYRELYLLCDAGPELLVVDVHAAHERVNYERLERAFDGADVETAELEPPETLSLSGPEIAALDAHAETLARLGFDASPFGGDTVRVRSVPTPFGRPLDAVALRDTLDRLADGETVDPGAFRDELIADLACHPSLKRGDDVDIKRGRQLLDRLGECERPFRCPHGRPTVLSIDADTLAAGFDRRDG